ncbi:HAD family hydrolase [Actinoallomurus sp. CA-150999]|uniref:HAD family hydrolase n=1 Tax=Actinoallomurus sp. CA-150999 TaxID=3239887 RepID=UPI003D8BC992
MSSTSVRALIFDFDGVILDTETPLFESWAEIYRQYGCEPFTVADWARELGGKERGSAPLAKLIENAAVEIDRHKVLRARRAYGQRLLAREPVRPGLVEWLIEARRRRLPIGVASSSSLLYVVRHLRRIGVYEYFDEVLCCEPGITPKPAPDLYRMACEALGVEPAEALAVEDSPNGVAAARAAGLRCLAVPNRITENLDLSEANARLDSFSVVTLEAIIALVSTDAEAM